MFGFLIAVVAGFLTPHLEQPLARPVIRALDRFLPIEPGEHRLIAFMIAVLAAAVVSALLDTGSTFGVVLGAVIGYFALRLSTLIKAQIDKPRN